MAEITRAVALELPRPILDFFMHADERQAVKTANTLRFWRDVMLGHLEKIRDGEATDETFVALERDLKTSEKEARRAMMVLRTLRSRIGGGQLAKLIDNIVQSDGYGKEVIWYEINSLLTTRKAGNDVKSKALEICNQIAILNGETGSTPSTGVWLIGTALGQVRPRSAAR